MELFDKVYGCYYHVVRHILEEAHRRPITRKDMEAICRTYGFQESALAIVPKLTDGGWPLLKEKENHTYSSRLLLPPAPLPLTTLQRSWLRALIRDERIRLFLDDRELRELDRCLGQTEPLYDQGDFYCFDQYLDGDAYASPEYRTHFQTILRSIREQKELLIAYEGKKGRTHTFEAVPFQLQYSSKDDKFRLCCLMRHRGSYSRNTLLNLARIKDCHMSRRSPDINPSDYRFRPSQKASLPVLLEINGERNSLERCMLHFANYEKHTEYHEDSKCWHCSIHYDLADETELLIDILSFGPVVRVLGPDSFLRQIRRRVKRQHELLYGTIRDSGNDNMTDSDS